MNRRSRPHVLVALCAPLAAVGCLSDDNAVADPMDGLMAESGPTWSEDVRAIVADHCVGCHVDGGIGPFPMDSYEAARSVSAAALAAIEAGRMPPWMPAQDCRPLMDDRTMPLEAIETFRAWVEAGTPEGEPSAAIAPAQQGERTPEIVAAPTGTYTPVAGASGPDDYRCFLLDHVFEADTYLAESWVAPGVAAIVHHVLVHVVGPEDAAQAQALEGADGQPGFPCFGAMTGGPIGWWVPGLETQRYPGRSAKVFPAGSQLMMQVHYNVLAAAPEPDLTTFNIITREAPEQLAVTVGLGNREIVIPPDDAASTHVRSFRNTGSTDWVLTEIAGHMHLLGTQLRVETVRADGDVDCVLDIPQWDFDWQLMYRFAENDAVRVAPGEELRLTCVYDNTLANQPLIDGERMPPQTVRWGEGTLDEMCLAYVTREAPLDTTVAAPAACRNIDTCQLACRESDFTCLFACSWRRSGCGECLVQEMFFGGCGSQACRVEAQAASPCLAACRRDSSNSVGECLASTCPAEMNALNACMTPVLSSGACEGAITLCGG